MNAPQSPSQTWKLAADLLNNQTRLISELCWIFSYLKKEPFWTPLIQEFYNLAQHSPYKLKIAKTTFSLSHHIPKEIAP